MTSFVSTSNGVLHGSQSAEPSLHPASPKQLQRNAMSTLQDRATLVVGNLPPRHCENGGSAKDATRTMGSTHGAIGQHLPSAATSFVTGNELADGRDDLTWRPDLWRQLRERQLEMQKMLCQEEQDDVQPSPTRGLAHDETAARRYRHRVNLADSSEQASPSGCLPYYVAPRASRFPPVAAERALAESPVFNLRARHLSTKSDPLLLMPPGGSTSYGIPHHTSLRERREGCPPKTVINASNIGDFSRYLVEFSKPGVGKPIIQPTQKRRSATSDVPKRKRRRKESESSPEIERHHVLGSPMAPTTVWSLATSDDRNWLSPFMCFIRSDLTEVFKANEDDVRSRLSSKKVILGQVGIRCKHCSHAPYDQRTHRSSCFPSSLSRIYQSITMMIREHFTSCRHIHPEVKMRFSELRRLATQGAADSKHFWMSSASAIGMRDTESSGIAMDDSSRDAGHGVAVDGDKGS